MTPRTQPVVDGQARYGGERYYNRCATPRFCTGRRQDSRTKMHSGKLRTSQAKTRIHTYRATASDCKACPIRQQCTRGLKRTLSVPFDEAARQDIISLQNTEAFQRSRILRRKVEMLFGHMKRQFRFTRLKLRGLGGAREEFLLVATVQNLRRLVRMRPPDIPKDCRAATT